MTPRDVLAFGVVVFGTLAGASLLVTSAQGRGIDDSTAYAATAGALAATAAAIGVAIGWPGGRGKSSEKRTETKSSVRNPDAGQSDSGVSVDTDTPPPANSP